MPNIGDLAPRFSGPEVQGGDMFRLRDHHGKAVVIAFNGLTWCSHCIREVPILQELSEEMESLPVQFVIISVGDAPLNDNTLLIQALEQYEITIPTLNGPDISTDYGVEGFPRLFILDRQQKIHDIQSGFPYDPDIGKEKIRKGINGALVPWGCLYEIARKLGIVFLFNLFRNPQVIGKSMKLPQQPDKGQ